MLEQASRVGEPEAQTVQRQRRRREAKSLGREAVWLASTCFDRSDNQRGVAETDFRSWEDMGDARQPDVAAWPHSFGPTLRVAGRERVHLRLHPYIEKGLRELSGEALRAEP